MDVSQAIRTRRSIRKYKQETVPHKVVEEIVADAAYAPSWKNTQIARTERLLETLPAEQKPAFQTLLEQVISDRDEIQAELDELHKILAQIKDEPPAKLPF